MNIFLFFYLFILFIILTPGIIINLSIMKSSPYSKYIVAAIHGFLFAAIAITTYSLVNDLYIAWLNPLQEGNIGITSGLKYTYATDGSKVFNTPSTTPPTPSETTNANGPTIKCGKGVYGNGDNWCGSVDPANQQVFCYGETGGCLIGKSDCNTDSDCTKYTSTSKRYSDYSVGMTNNVCKNFDGNGWSGKFCKMFGYPTKN